MAVSADVLRAEIRAKDRASAAIRKVKGSVGGLANSMAKLRNASLLAAAAGGAFLAFAAKAVSLSAKQESVNRRLALALEKIGVSYNSVRGEINKFAAAQQASTEFGDDQTKSVLTTLVQLTGDYDAALKGVSATQDIATALGMSLESASRLVARAMGGNISVLSRYLPKLQGLSKSTLAAMTLQEKQALVLREIEGAFGGAAKAISPIEQGMANLRNTMGDVTEAFGKMLTEAGSLTDKSGWFLSFLQFSEDWFNVTRKGVSAFEDVDAAVKAFVKNLQSGTMTTEGFTTTVKRFNEANVDIAHIIATKFNVAAGDYVRLANQAHSETKEWAAAQKSLADKILEAQGRLVAFNESEGMVITGGKSPEQKQREKDAAAVKKSYEERHKAALRNVEVGQLELQILAGLEAGRKKREDKAQSERDMAEQRIALSKAIGEINAKNTQRFIADSEKAKQAQIESMAATKASIASAVEQYTLMSAQMIATSRTGQQAMLQLFALMLNLLAKWAAARAGEQAAEAYAAYARRDFDSAAFHTAASVGFAAVAGGAVYGATAVQREASREGAGGGRGGGAGGGGAVGTFRAGGLAGGGGRAAPRESSVIINFEGERVVTDEQVARRVGEVMRRNETGATGMGRMARGSPEAYGRERNRRRRS